MTQMTRRHFGLLVGAGTATLALPTYLRAQDKPKVVVIGGGAGGATVRVTSPRTRKARST
jgi:sulfide dehydrogenase [flavocytochrome c] flavoprotein subunit